MRAAAPITWLAIPLLLCSAGTGFAQTVDTTLWVTDGYVYSVVRDGGTIYVGGSFQYVGPSTGGFVAIDPSTAAALQPYPKVAGGSVIALAPDGSGGWYLGGDFTSVRGQPRNRLAHVDATGNLTAWNPNANATVQVLAVSGGTIYAGGRFTTIGGQPRNAIAAVDATTGAATGWNPDARYGVGVGTVDALAVSGGTIYAGGEFSSIGGQLRNAIAALDATSGAATGWNPNAIRVHEDADAVVGALAVNGGIVYAGGWFTSIGGQTRNGIAALDAASGAATGWNPDARYGVDDGTVDALVVSGGTIYAAGGFTSIGGQPRSSIAALDATSGAATAWNPDAPSGGAVQALVVGGGTVYVGGGFTRIGGQERNHIAALDATSGAVTAWNPGTSAFVRTLAVSGSTIYAGGDFFSVGGQPRSNIAALDATSGVATTWNPNADLTVRALAVSGGTIYASGNFYNIGGQPRRRIAALDATSGAATAWIASTGIFDTDPITALAVSGGTIYAGGFGVAAFDTASGVRFWFSGMSGNVDHGVLALAVSGGTVYVGGTFASLGGQSRDGIGALDATNGAVTPWPSPGFGGRVYALAVSGSTVYAGGGFAGIAGQLRSGIAALDVVSGAATAWNPGADGAVYALAVSGSTVYAGGNFTHVGGQPRRGIAALRVATGSATAWNPNGNGEVDALAVSGGTIYAGGYSYLAAIQLSPPDTTQPDPRFSLPVTADPGAIELGERFSISVDVSNLGLDTDDGRISVSFPAFTGPTDGLWVDGTTSRDPSAIVELPAGSPMVSSTCQPIAASCLAVEYRDGSWWGGESNDLTLQVLPRATGTFYFYVRATMHVPYTPCLQINGLPAEGEPGFVDQQGWPVTRFAVQVIPAPAAGWHRLPPPGGPSARFSSSMVYHPGRDALVLYGGADGTSHYLTDVWALPLDLVGPWTQLAPGGPVPLRRINQSMILNPREDHLVVFGGMYFAPLNDLTALALSPLVWWFPAAPSGPQPSVRFGQSAVYDPLRHRMLVIGGFGDACLNDVWEYPLPGNGTWTQLSPSGTPMPARLQHAAVYDPVRDRVLVFGGDGGTFLNDVWELRLGGTLTWNQIVPSGPLPAGRREHTMIYDSKRDRLVVFGGFNYGVRLNDVWALSLGDPPTWTLLDQPTPPSPRMEHAAVYDPIRDRMIVFGGDVGTNQFSNELWSLGFPDTPTPTQVSFGGADVSADRVRLSWSSPEASALQADVERSEVAGQWALLGAASLEGDRLVFEDRNVAAGTRYGYRLVERGPGAVLDEQWVTVPPRAVLALTGASPNPAPDDLWVAFSLPDENRTTLELFDLKGRLLEQREVGTLGIGAHRVALSTSRRLPAGVYLVRLVRADRTLTAKACVVR